MIPARGKVLVKRVETAPSIPGGKIVLTERTREDMTSQQMEVLDVGAPAVCEDDDCERHHHYTSHAPSCEREAWWIPCECGAIATHPVDAKAGDWVLVAHRSLLETDQDGIYVVSQDDVLAILEP